MEGEGKRKERQGGKEEGREIRSEREKKGGNVLMYLPEK